MISILIADDHKLFRETLSQMLSANQDFEVIALCEDSEQAIDIVRTEKPDIVLMDINMHPLNGIDATSKIRSFSSTNVIALSMHTHTGFAKNMLRAGARGYVTKNSSKDEICIAINEVAKGNKYICSEIKDMLSEQVINDSPETPCLSLLTGRELQIIKLIREGLSSKEIAVSINVAVKTVEVHRHNILRKLKLRNASSLVNFVYSNAG